VEKWLAEREGIVIDWAKIPTNDPLAYEILAHGQTMGVFQLESEGMTALVKRLRPTEFADLTALIALYRPGPLQAGMHDMYVERKHGRQRVTFDHPLLEPILRETYGVIVYQEQVMRISTDMCGFTKGDADVLRKAMGKKKADVMEKMKAKFIDGAEKSNGVGRELAASIWDNIVTFAGYGFNKSHSAAYAVVTFQTAYLRAHFPVFFQAALLTNEIDGTTDAIAKYVANCREVGITVEPADINKSREYFNPDARRIWYALNGVKGVGTAFALAVLAEREARGPFRSLQDFCMRMPREAMNSRTVEALIKVGAFDSLHKNRSSLMAALPEILSIASEAAREAESGLSDMFAADGDSGGEGLVADVPLPPVPPWDDKERAAFEKEFLGFYLTDHPLNRYRIEFESFAEHQGSDIEAKGRELESRPNDRIRMTVMGMISDITVKTDKNGNPWGIVHLEDLSGPFECKMFSRTFGTYRDDLQLDQVVRIEGQVSLWAGRVSFEGNTVTRVEALRDEARGVVLTWEAGRVSKAAITELAETCRRFAGSRPVRIAVRQGDGAKAEFNPSLKIQLSPAAMDALRALPGQPGVRYIPPPPAAQTGNGRGDYQRRAAGR